jgi:peptidoglycan hydrolase-like protein with peptidoglycan-binding domain
MLKQGDKGQAVYDYQTVCKEAGYDVGDWANMKDSNIKDGRDGSFGTHMKEVTEAAQKEFGMKVTGYVDADTYGRIANKAIINIVNKSYPAPVYPRVLKVSDKVIVNGKGYSASDKSGSRTNRLYSNQAMKINKIEKSAKAPYHLEINGVDIGWFEESQIK